MTSQLIGFSTYQKPGVYTKTIRSSDGFNSFTGYRVPTLVGPASELVLVEDVAVMRGSSASFPIRVERDDLSFQAIQGGQTVFKLSHSPVVNPDTSTVTNIPAYVELEINGVVIEPASLEGEDEEGNSYIYTPFPVEAGSRVYVTYHYIRRDKEVTDEDLTEQADGTTATFYLQNKNVVDFSNKGFITNDPQFLTVTVNNIVTPVYLLDGLEGSFTLPSPPSAAAIIKVSYRYSDYQNLSDPLPSKFVQRIVRIGSVPQKSEYVQGVDYSFTSEGTASGTVNNMISWGNSFVNLGLQGKGDDFENDWITGDNIDIQVVDTKIYGEVLKPVFTQVGSPNTYTFEAKNTITDGNGRGTYLSGSVFNAEIVGVYAGVDAYRALPGGLTVDGNKVAIRRIDGKNKKVYLKTAINPKTTNIYLVYYTNQMQDETYRFVKNSDDGMGNSTYSISSSTYGYVPKVSLVTPNVPQNISYSLSYDDYRVNTSASVDETVTVTLSALLPVQITSTTSAAGTFLVSSAIPSADISGDLITYNFTSTIPRDYFAYAGSTFLTVTGMVNASNNVTAAEVVSAGVNTITVRVGSAGVLESVAIPSPSVVVSVTFDSTKVLRYTVTSNVSGATGSNTSVNTQLTGTLREGMLLNQGVLGEPYVDPVTGFSFTFRYTPDFTFLPGNTFVFNITKNGVFSNDLRKFNIMLRGIRFRVPHLDGVAVGQGLSIQTNNFSSEKEPKLGDIYYVSYYYYRIDYTLRTFLSFAEVQRVYGKPNLTNPLSLAARLAFENGAPVLAIKPLQWYDETTLDDFLNREYDPALREIEEIELYKESIDALDAPFTGDRRPYFIVPLTDNDQIISYLAEHVDLMSSPEARSERFGIVGFGTNRSDNHIMERARNLNNNRLMVMYPNSALMNVLDEDNNFGRTIVPGYYYAVAMAGLASRSDLLPSDPLTRRTLTGFVNGGVNRTRLQLNEIANQGITIIEKEDPVFRIRHAMTTNVTNAVNREPTATFIADYVHVIARKVNERFIARPFINSILGEIETVFSAMMNFIQRSGIIVAYKDLSVTQSPNDPTIVLITVAYAPVLPINYILITFDLKARFN